MTTVRGTTPCAYKAYFTDWEYARVVWPDGGTSDTKGSPTKLNTANLNFHFVKPNPVVVQASPVIPRPEIRFPISLPPRTWAQENIAIANLTVYALSRAEAMTLTAKVHSSLVRTDYFAVLSRSDMKSVLVAQQFQHTDACDDTSCLVEMGKILSVSKIVGGTLGKVGSTFSFVLRFVDVETGKTEFTVDGEWKGEVDALLKLVQDKAQELAAEYAHRKAKR